MRENVFDIYLKICPHNLLVPEYPKSRVTRNVTVQEEIAIGEKLTKETRASNAARHDFDHQLAHVRYLEKVDPKYPGNSEYNLAIFRNQSFIDGWIYIYLTKLKIQNWLVMFKQKY